MPLLARHSVRPLDRQPQHHPDWDDYRRAMVADQRAVLRLPVERAYGMAG